MPWGSRAPRSALYRRAVAKVCEVAPGLSKGRLGLTNLTALFAAAIVGTVAMGFFISEESGDEFAFEENPGAGSSDDTDSGGVVILGGHARMSDLASPTANGVERLSVSISPRDSSTGVDIRGSTIEIVHDGRTIRLEILDAGHSVGFRAVPVADHDRSLEEGVLNSLDVAAIEIDVKAAGVLMKRGDVFTFGVHAPDANAAARYRVPLLVVPGDEVALERA